MTTKVWLKKAKEEGFAIGAFNVGNLEVFKAIVTAASKKRSPIIIESSPGETKWMGADNIVDLAKNYSWEFGIPIMVNLDHAGSLEECLIGIEAGYDLIHFDGSELPLKENIEIAKKVVDLAHKKSIFVEGEMDHIIGSSEVHSGSAKKDLSKARMTDPKEAVKFVKTTGIDIFAVFIGNIHGVYSEGGEKLNLKLLKEITQDIKSYFSLHGGSGILGDDIKGAVKLGINKVNINTEIRQIFKDTLEDVLKKNSKEYALYKIEGPVLQKVEQLVESKIDLFGSLKKI